MNRKILIAYYSHSANTKKIAEEICMKTGGTLCEIQPEILYPVDYNTVVEQAKKEIKAGFRPPLKTKADNMEAYDLIFIGSPNWWSTIAPPIATFLEENDLSGKTVAPFCTHGGGGEGKVKKDIAKLCPQSTITSCLSVHGSGGKDAQSKVSSWLREIGV